MSPLSPARFAASPRAAQRELPALSDPSPRHLVRLAEHLAGQRDLWAPHVRFAQHERHTVRVAVSDDYEAWLLTWLPGQSTGLHDHGTSAGAFVVLDGVLHESVLPPLVGRAAATLVHHRVTVGQARGFGPDHLHDVGNVEAEPAVSLHVYAPALETMRRFVLDDRGAPQVVAVEQSGADW